MRSSCLAKMSRFIAGRRHASSKATGTTTAAIVGTARAARRTAAIPSSVVVVGGIGRDSTVGSPLLRGTRRRPAQERAATRVEALCRVLTAASPAERRRTGAILARKFDDNAPSTSTSSSTHSSVAATTAAAAAAAAASSSSASSSSPSPFLDLPEPRDIKVKTARYVGSSVTPSGCPRIPPPGPWLPEFALLGRSNVGKSSLVNCLAGRARGPTATAAGPGSSSSASLAMVSSTPGKTATINHYLINESWYLVDLPGYGYARKAQKTRCDWAAFTQAYLLERPTLASAFLLADVSVPPQDADVEAAVWMAERNVPFSVVFTKADKRKKASKAPPPEVNAAELKKLLAANLPGGGGGGGEGELPPIFATSSVTGAGRKELLAYISQLRQLCGERWAAEGLDLGHGGEGGGAGIGASAAGAAGAAAAALRRGKDGGAPDDVSDDEWW